MYTIDGNKIKPPFDEGRDKVSEDIYPRGKVCFVLRNDEAVEEAKQLFGRMGDDSLCLKIHFTPMTGEIADYDWGVAWAGHSRDRTEEIGRLSKLSEATTIQNWLWMEGLAPRVYGIVLVERNQKLYPAQLTEFVEGGSYETVDEVQDQLDVVIKALDKFSCSYVHRELISRADFVRGKIVDLQGFRFTPKTQERVKDFASELGKYGKTHYQDIDAIGITNKPRNTKKRILAMHLEEIDFKGKDVLDVGCNSGIFCHYAVSNGARRVTGLDLPQHTRVAEVLAYYLGFHNIDYVPIDLIVEPFNWRWDIAFFLSMNVHIGFPSWVGKYTRELMVFEENAKQSLFKPDYWTARLYKWFPSVELIGTTNDQNRLYHKPIFHCRKMIESKGDV